MQYIILCTYIHVFVKNSNRVPGLQKTSYIYIYIGHRSWCGGGRVVESIDLWSRGLKNHYMLIYIIMLCVSADIVSTSSMYYILLGRRPQSELEAISARRIPRFWYILLCLIPSYSVEPVVVYGVQIFRIFIPVSC